MATYRIYPGDEVLVWCMRRNCGKWVSLPVPDRCPDCEVKQEGIRDQAEDFDCPDWLARQAREHPAQDVTPRKE